jgi:hypothetical protein
VQENLEGLKLNGRRNSGVCGDDIKLLRENTNTLKRDAENWAVISK